MAKRRNSEDALIVNWHGSDTLVTGRLKGLLRTTRQGSEVFAGTLDRLLGQIGECDRYGRDVSSTYQGAEFISKRGAIFVQKRR